MGADRPDRREDGWADPGRILIYGVTGSGKTTLAKQIGEITGLPWHSADDEIGWLPNWSEQIAAWQADPTAPPVVRLRSPRLTEEWLAGLRIRNGVGS